MSNADAWDSVLSSRWVYKCHVFGQEMSLSECFDNAKCEDLGVIVSAQKSLFAIKNFFQNILLQFSFTFPNSLTVLFSSN